MNTETIDKLYLELSQVASARTEREITARMGVAQAITRLRQISGDHPPEDVPQRIKEVEAHLNILLDALA